MAPIAFLRSGRPGASTIPAVLQGLPPAPLVRDAIVATGELAPSPLLFVPGTAGPFAFRGLMLRSNSMAAALGGTCSATPLVKSNSPLPS